MTRDQARLQLKCKASSWRTICEVHREMFDLSQKLTRQLRLRLQELCIDAFIMGKKMDGKLKSYKQDWDAGFYEKNKDRHKDRERRLRK